MKNLRPPFYTVIFSSVLKPDAPGYEEMARRMLELARGMPGFLGVESARGEDGAGITVSYWESLEAVRAWGAQAEHRAAQARGKSEWYSNYSLRVAQVLEQNP